MKMKKNIIIGAGPAGLATGLGLVERSVETEIYDAGIVPGGLAASESIDGMVFDYGPHIFHTHDEEMKKLWLDYFADLLVEKEFYSKNYKDGIFYDYPLSYESISKFPSKIKDQVQKELKERKPENLKRAQNFKECLIAILGPTLQELFFEKYTKKLWGISPEDMSTNWAPKRIEIRKKYTSFWHNQFSAAAKYGSGSVMQRIADKIIAKGGKVFLRHKVTKLFLEDSRIKKIFFENGKAIDTEDAIVISTIPLDRLCDTLGIKCTLDFNSIIIVYLVFNKEYILPEGVQSVYFAHDDCYFHRVSEQKKFSDIGYPKGKTMLTFEISYNNKPFLAEMDEERLVRETLSQFSAFGLAKEKDFVKGFTRRFTSVNPILKYAYEGELMRVNSILSLIKNLHTVGGSAEFIYGDMQVMFSKARDIVDLLTSEHYVINKNIKSGEQFRFNEEVQICDYKVGKENPTLIIAEMGINHNGDVNLAKQLISEAKRCGCEVVKLQTFSAEARVSKTAKNAKYADKTLDMEETPYETFKRLELSREDHKILFDYAKDIKMPLISTPFSESDVDLLCELGVKAFKIASFDLVNLPFLRYVASKRLPIILSCGMSGMAEIEEALETIALEENPNVVLLHCVSSYPADPKDANLRAMHTMRQAFKVPVGYSDHSISQLVAIMSMTLGAHILERHFTLNKKFEGTDHILSSTPEEMAQLVDDRNSIYSALGSGIKKQKPVEYGTINKQRKSIFTTKPIKSGEKITLDNITIKGPGHGILPRYIHLILGKRVAKRVNADSPLTWDDLLIS
ncbi:MAG: N-acetylneuraminate synthase family protein [Candidatus Omnitrophica bacterium]|nr:N-acetylneuraminate synthase family protein [Candidatus Omnitrophota bacterium]